MTDTGTIMFRKWRESKNLQFSMRRKSKASGEKSFVTTRRMADPQRCDPSEWHRIQRRVSFLHERRGFDTGAERYPKELANLSSAIRTRVGVEKMNSLFEEKYDELFTEFNRYVVEHPEFARRIPRDALVVLLDKNDPEFTHDNLRRVEGYRKHDDKSNRPIVYVQVGRLAPAKSRLRNPRLMTRLPDYAA